MEVGDIIIIAGDDYRIEDASNLKEYTLAKVNTVCIACEGNHVDPCIEEMQLCASCLSRALMFVAVKRAIDNVGDFDVPMARSLRAMEEYDDANMVSGIAYVDTQSSAIDALYGIDDATMLAYMRDAIMPCIDAMRGR